MNLIRDCLGEIFLPYVHPLFEDEEDDRVLVVRFDKGPKACFVKDSGKQRFFVRSGNATAELSGTAITPTT